MKTGLVLEGGACRGVFTTGVLDVMLERELAFDYCIGVSAGAGNAMNFKSRQKGRAYELVACSGGASYYGLDAARRSGRLVDLDLVYNEMSYEGDNPFDFAAYYRNPMEVEYTVTCCEDGRAEYLSENVYQKRLIEIVKASCSMPGFCGMVKLDGKHYLDGGIADPMPVRRAMEEKQCDRVVLVTTKPADDLHPTDYSKVRHILHRLYGRKYPDLYDALMTRIPRYFAEMAWIEEQQKQGKVFLIRPRVCHIKGLERDREKMQQYYLHGRNICTDLWEDLTAYLQ